MSAHTAGPWHWDSDAVKNDPTGRVRYRVTALGKTVTQVYYSSYEGGLTNAEDDARLIAAAPDMLALLQRFKRFSETSGFSYPLGSLQELTAIVAKATGST